MTEADKQAPVHVTDLPNSYPPATDPGISAGTSAQTARAMKPALVQTFLGTLVVLVISGLSGILTARFLGPSERGDLATLLFFPLLFGQLGSLGIHFSVAYETSRRPAERADLLVSSLSLALLICIPLAAISWITLPLFLPHDRYRLLLAARLVALDMILWIFQAILQGSKRGAFQFKRYNIIRIVPPVAEILIVVLVYLLHFETAVYFAIGFVIGHFMGVVIGALTAWNDLKCGRPRRAEMEGLLKSGLRFQVPQVSELIFDRADEWLIIALLSPAQVGQYTVAFVVSQIQSAVGNAFVTVGFVKVAGELNHETAKKSFLSQFRYAQIINLVLGTGAFLLAGPVILLAFGSEYSEAARIAPILVIATNLAGLNKIMDNGLRALGHVWVGAVSNVAGLGALVAGAVLLVPGGGIRAMSLLLAGLVTPLMLGVSLLFLMWREKVPLREIYGLRPDVVKSLYRIVRARGKPAASA